MSVQITYKMPSIIGELKFTNSVCVPAALGSSTSIAKVLDSGLKDFSCLHSIKDDNHIEFIHDHRKNYDLQRKYNHPLVISVQSWMDRWMNGWMDEQIDGVHNKEGYGDLDAIIPMLSGNIDNLRNICIDFHPCYDTKSYLKVSGWSVRENSDGTAVVTMDPYIQD